MTKGKAKKNSNGAGKFFLGAALGALAGAIAGKFASSKSCGCDKGDECCCDDDCDCEKDCDCKAEPDQSEDRTSVDAEKKSKKTKNTSKSAE